MNKTIEIYKNYGCLTAEKRSLYTYGAEHATAVCSDKMTVEIPDGWTLSETVSGSMIITAPWGWNYQINEVLAGDANPVFSARDKDGRNYIKSLKVVKRD